MLADMDIYLLSENAIFDEVTETIVLQVSNVSISLTIDEFIDFSNRIEEATESLFKMPEYVIGTFTSDDGENKITLLRKPDNEEYM